MGIVDKSSSAENPSPIAGRNWFERMLVSLIGMHTPRCREVVRLLSQSMEINLPLTTRIKIRFHYLICVWCYRYGKQIRVLRSRLSARRPRLENRGSQPLEHLGRAQCPEGPFATRRIIPKRVT